MWAVCLSFLRFSELCSEVIINSLTTTTGRDSVKVGKMSHVKDKRNYI